MAYRESMESTEWMERVIMYRTKSNCRVVYNWDNRTAVYDYDRMARMEVDRHVIIDRRKRKGLDGCGKAAIKR